MEKKTVIQSNEIGFISFTSSSFFSW